MLNGQDGTWKSALAMLKSELSFQHGQLGTLKSLPSMLKSGRDTLKRHLPMLNGQRTLQHSAPTLQHRQEIFQHR